MIRFSCSCGKLLQVKDELAGQRVRCPDCGAVQVVPGTEGVTPARRETSSPVTSAPRARASPGAEDEPSVGEPAASGKAITSLILGILSFGCSFLTGIPGIILAIMALGDVNRSRGQVSGHGMAITGLILSSVGMLCSLVLLPPLLLLPAVQKVRTAASRAQSQNNLKQIIIAMHNHNDAHGHLPGQAIYSKDGRPLLSWRVAILPFIEQQNLYNQFHLDEPWDSPHNKSLLAMMPRTYNSPAAPPEDALQGQTHYLAFFGKSAAFEGKEVLRIPRDFPDGMSNTILAMEVKQSVPWTKPEDIPFDPNGAAPQIDGLYSGDFIVCLMDGSVRIISKKVSSQTLKAAITRNGNDVLGPDW